jgi:oligopeptide transport system permease protein
MTSDPSAFAGATTTVGAEPGTAGADVPAGGGTAQAVASGKPRSLWSDAWRDLRRKPLFWVASAIILLLLVMSAWPGLFTSVDPTHANLSESLDKPSRQHILGVDVQGYDLYARAVYGTRVSIIVGVLTTLGAAIVGGVVGILAGFYGRYVDTVFSRVTDIFLGLPFILGAIVLLSTFVVPGEGSKLKIMTLVIVALITFGWPVFARMMRASVISAKSQDYVIAARALGASNSRIIWRHLLPNCLAPLLVLSTISLGGYIGAEATLSFLGIGLQYPVISWGVMLNDAQNYIKVVPHTMVAPALFLSVTVLTFVMLGDAVREALDPKLR